MIFLGTAKDIRERKRVEDNKGVRVICGARRCMIYKYVRGLTARPSISCWGGTGVLL